MSGPVTDATVEAMVEAVARAICLSFTGHDAQWKYWTAEARAAIAAMEQAAAPPAPLVPDGWRLVPVEPTPEMLAAAVATPGMKAVDSIVVTHAIRTGHDSLADQKDPALVQAWRTMLAAAPAAPPAEAPLPVDREPWFDRGAKTSANPCRSAITPCSHQQRSPHSACDHCLGIEPAPTPLPEHAPAVDLGPGLREAIVVLDRLIWASDDVTTGDMRSALEQAALAAERNGGAADQATDEIEGEW